MTVGLKLALPWREEVEVTSSNIGTKTKTSKFFLSETGGHTALIFCMKNLLVDLYQGWSHDVPGIKRGPARVSQVCT